MPKDPWFKFYPTAWESDTKLQSCSLEAQGFLIKLMCMMHQSEQPGKLLLNGLPPQLPTLYALSRVHHHKGGKCLGELLEKGVLIEEDGVLVCPRMVRDHALREMFREYGKKGGNPELTKKGVKGRDFLRDIEVRDIEKDPMGTIVPLSGDGKCPYQLIVDLYHEKLPTLPKVRIIGKTLKGQLNQRWKERPSVGWFENYLDFISESKFLTGQKTDFVANLRWITGPENMEKILNNEYHRKEGPLSRKAEGNLRALLRWAEKKGDE